MQFEIVYVLVEIGTRRGLNAETATSEGYLVQIEGENVGLVQHAFDPAGEDHLLQLAGDGIFVAEQDVLGDLLRDGRSAHRSFAGAELRRIVEHGIRGAGEVHPAMAEKGLVFRREKRLDQRLRKVVVLQLDAAFAGIGVNDLAIRTAHAGRQRCLVIEQRLGIR